MKVIAPFFMILFIAFLSTPAIVKLIEKSTDTAMFFNVSEEEHAKEEMKNIFCTEAITSVFELKRIIIGSLILSENLSKHENISKRIFSPPPNFV
ncbi:hypothetical protein [Flavobacterium seoulense]|nr:hypothetical protein [Flavobacterium seoulense]